MPCRWWSEFPWLLPPSVGREGIDWVRSEVDSWWKEKLIFRQGLVLWLKIDLGGEIVVPRERQNWVVPVFLEEVDIGKRQRIWQRVSVS